MSLADELLADLNAIEDDDVDEDEGEDGIEEVHEMESEPMDIANQSVRNIAKLRDSKELQTTLKDMDNFLENPRSRNTVFGPVEQDPEYQLIVKANNLTVEIENEMSIINKYCRDHYSKRFPELDSLVPNALEYIQTIQVLQNDLNPTKIDNMDFLQPATRMVLSVTAATTQGIKIENEELEYIMEACQMSMDLVNAKLKIFQYVESRMSFIAPNVSVIVGASTAAKMMGLAGGLTNLSKMPSCNILLLGSQKKTLAGFSMASAQVMPHTGFVYYSDIVQSLPPYLRRKAARQVAAKFTLAARIDSFHESLDGSAGQKLLEEIERKFEKWQEPPPVKEVKALPRPDDAPRQKRGGRRVRKMKEKFAVTEMRRQASRVTFGEISEDIFQDHLGFGIGSLAKDSSSGKVRNAAIDKKTQVSISKRLQRNLANMNQAYGGKSTVRSHVSGTASSVAFTPLQGIEIVNPKAAEKRVAEANAKYFSNQSGFFNVKKNDENM
ncbi:U4/U6 small nuclear ribonucleoprotein Prp31 [Hydra vulgaris]|uniref:U4/U6 small nuclear ribonucleoprotein Prp31 n=2 Tax=Hydra vulgaris TaxID=6087 RepID=A0ABM4CI60_HYDVU|nr:U4/U6 small nuclear ribonucleoprotein Prp31 [Hydra vulgaris]XP_047132888.1 U4/U6 small nuclear ribonucleoprotein Prp31 [Hydra vulgaris]